MSFFRDVQNDRETFSRNVIKEKDMKKIYFSSFLLHNVHI